MRDRTGQVVRLRASALPTHRQRKSVTPTPWLGGMSSVVAEVPIWPSSDAELLVVETFHNIANDHGNASRTSWVAYFAPEVRQA